MLTWRAFCWLYDCGIFLPIARHTDRGVPVRQPLQSRFYKLLTNHPPEQFQLQLFLAA
jgi:hypothetical protein